MGQFWSKLDAPSTSTMEKFSNHQTKQPQLRKTSYLKKILNRRKVTKKRPTISSPHQANPIYLNGHKWRHVIITMPSKDQPPLPPQRQKRKMKLSTCMVVQKISCRMMPLPVTGSVKFESHVKLFQTFIMMGLATYLPTLRRVNLQSNHIDYGTKDNSCSRSTNYFQSEDRMAIEELFWHPIAASHQAKKFGHKWWSQPRFTVIRRKRRNQREAVSTTKSNETSNQPQPVHTRTEFWQKFKRRMRPDGKRITVGPTMRSLAKKVNQLCYLIKHRSLSSQKNMDNETNTSSFVNFYSSTAPFDLTTSQRFEPAEDSDCSISDSLSEFSCSL